MFWPYFALAAVCFFWGTTYLGIRMALESLPPLVLVCVRYLISGAIMTGFAVVRGLTLPRGRDLCIACLSGFFVLAVGNACVVFAETMIPSGLAGLIVTTSPFWLVGIEAAMPGGARLHAPTVVGMVVGLAGAALLFSPDAGAHTPARTLLWGFLILQCGMASWSWGSIYQARQGSKAHPVVVGAVQQLAAGVLMAPLALGVPSHPIVWSARGIAALLYLVVFGTIVGYSAYVYSMATLPVAMVSIYPYVNSVVAVTLGWLFYREPFGIREGMAMLVIFAGVAIVKRYSRPHPPSGAGLTAAAEPSAESAAGHGESGDADEHEDQHERHGDRQS